MPCVRRKDFLQAQDANQENKSSIGFSKNGKENIARSSKKNSGIADS